MGAASIGIGAAVLTDLVSEHRSYALVAGGFILSSGLYVAAIFAARAGAPRDFYVAGGNPDSLRQWSWTGGSWRNEIEMLDAIAERYGQSIAANRTILESNTKNVTAAFWIAGISTLLSIAVFFVFHCATFRFLF